MNILKRIIATAILVLIIDYFMKSIWFDATGADLAIKSIMFAVVFGLLNAIVKPIIKLFALPITIMTLGLFSLVINLIILYMATFFVPQFHFDGIIAALIFSLILSVSQSVTYTVLGIK